MSQMTNSMPRNRGQAIVPVNPAAVVRNYNQIALLIDASRSTVARMVKEIGGERKVMKVWELIKESTMNVLHSLMTAETNVIASHLFISIGIFQGKEVIDLVPSTLLTDLDLDAVQARLDEIEPLGETPMGQAITTTLQRLAMERRRLMTSRTMGYPCMVIISDGEPTDDMTLAYSMVDDQLKMSRPHLTVRAIHIAVDPRQSEAKLKRLLKYAPDQDVLLLHNGEDFNKYVKLIEQTAIAINGAAGAPAQGIQQPAAAGAGRVAEAGLTGCFADNLRSDPPSPSVASSARRAPVKPVPYKGF